MFAPDISNYVARVLVLMALIEGMIGAFALAIWIIFKLKNASLGWLSKQTWFFVGSRAFLINGAFLSAITGYVIFYNLVQTAILVFKK